MISEQVAGRQLKRLTRLPFAPTEQAELRAAADEFRRLINRDCRTDAHLEAVIDHLMETAQRFPPPADLVEAIRDTPNPAAAKGPMGCGECFGSGWRSYVTTARPHKNGVPRTGYPAETADFCDCERGRWMRAADESRQQERNAKRQKEAFGS